MSFISNFTYPLVFKDKEIMKRYIEKFSGIEIRPLESNIIQQPFFKDNGYFYPNTKKIFDSSFFFPNNPDLTDEELKLICNFLRKVFIT